MTKVAASKERVKMPHTTVADNKVCDFNDFEKVSPVVVFQYH